LNIMTKTESFSSRNGVCLTDSFTGPKTMMQETLKVHLITRQLSLTL
jgi:hypothetical protein